MSEKRTSKPEQQQPSYNSLFTDMAARQEQLESQLAEVQSRPGFNLDAVQMMEKRREETRLTRELAAHRAEWSQYGGEAVDQAQAAVDDLSFRSDASDMVAAKLALRDAKNAFYQNYIDAHTEKSAENPKLPDLDDFGTDSSSMNVPLPGLEEFGTDDAEAKLPELDDFGADTPHDADSNQDDAAASTSDRQPLPDLDSFGVDTDTSSPELATIEAELATARSEWARISSKRQRRAFDRKNIKGYTAAKERYHELAQQRGRLLLADQLAATDNVSEKNMLAITYLAHEQNELRELVKHESDAKWSYKFARWMNSGSRKQRLAKGVAVGLVVGTGGSLLAGAAGATILAGGAVAASRFVRGYTARHTNGMEQLDTTKASESVAYRARMYEGDAFENSASLMNDYFERDSKREQAKRRKAVLWGVGSIAAGATLGSLVHVGIDHIAGWTEHNGFGGHVGVEHHSAASHADTHGGGSGDHHAAPAAPKPELHDFANAHNVYNVHPGEGWDETMKDMGIPEDKWAEVLKDAGPKLHDQHWAYFDNAHHEWRISKPGHLSEAAVRTLKDASARHGFSFR